MFEPAGNRARVGAVCCSTTRHVWIAQRDTLDLSRPGVAFTIPHLYTPAVFGANTRERYEREGGGRSTDGCADYDTSLRVTPGERF